ncbi:MAG: lasso RiPP family leader peptide-containing protein [Verrucomicrobia bacterium]|nr:lasso RiPP family leader peptide-containing protein [Verrucomicrobiota bacterium]
MKNKSEQVGGRSSYEKPKLIKYGSVRNLTTGGTSGMFEKGGGMGMGMMGMMNAKGKV